MARLPVPGSDKGNWGDILNDYLSQSLTSAGSIKTDIVNEANLTPAVRTKLNEGAPVTSVAGKTGDVVLEHTDVGAASEAQGDLADTAVQPDELNDEITARTDGDEALDNRLSTVEDDYVSGTTLSAGIMGRADTRLGPISTDFTSVNLNQAADAVTYNRQYIHPNVDSIADMGEGLQFWVPQGAMTNYGFGPFNAMPRSIRVMCNGDKFAWYQLSVAGGTNVMIYIDGRPASLTPYTPNASGTFNTIIFPTARARLIELRLWAGVAALYTQKPYDLWKPVPRSDPRVLIMGDSWTSNASAQNAMHSAYWNIGPQIGSDDVWVDYQGGTGYGVTSHADGQSGTQNRYLDRVGSIVIAGQTWNVATINPHMVVVHGGGANDKFKGRSNAQVITDVVSVFTTLRTKLPNAKLVFVEGFTPPIFSSYTSDYIAIRQGVQSALESVGAYYIDVATTNPWIKGAGTVAAPNADNENANIYVVSDAAHLNDSGHLYLRSRMGTLLRRVMLDDGSLLNQLISN